MIREHTTRTLIRRLRLRPSPERFAAAAVVQDPNLLLQLRAAQSNATQLDQAKVGILAIATTTRCAA